MMPSMISILFDKFIRIQVYLNRRDFLESSKTEPSKTQPLGVQRLHPCQSVKGRGGRPQAKHNPNSLFCWFTDILQLLIQVGFLDPLNTTFT